MFLRKMRWLCAAIVATVAAVATPARSMADSQILIQELDGGGNPVGGQIQISTGTSANFATTNFTNIQVTANPGFGAIGSLTTNVSANLASTLDPSHSLQVIVTVDGFTNPFPGQPALVSNTAGSSTGIVGGTNTITGNSQILAVPLSPGTSQTGALASGASLAGPTANSSATYNILTGPTTSGSTTATNPALPDAYAVQQTIIVRATPDVGGEIRTGSTVGGTVGSTIVTNAAPVPAPAGLVLALTAIPALGLRRFLRRKTA